MKNSIRCLIAIALLAIAFLPSCKEVPMLSVTDGGICLDDTLSGGLKCLPITDTSAVLLGVLPDRRFEIRQTPALEPISANFMDISGRTYFFDPAHATFELTRRQFRFWEVSTANPNDTLFSLKYSTAELLFLFVEKRAAEAKYALHIVAADSTCERINVLQDLSQISPLLIGHTERNQRICLPGGVGIVVIDPNIGGDPRKFSTFWYFPEVYDQAAAPSPRVALLKKLSLRSESAFLVLSFPENDLPMSNKKMAAATPSSSAYPTIQQDEQICLMDDETAAWKAVCSFPFDQFLVFKCGDNLEFYYKDDEDGLPFASLDLSGFSIALTLRESHVTIYADAQHFDAVSKLCDLLHPSVE